MSILPYVRVVNYLSASSLRQLEERPVDFYYRRCGPSEFVPPREEQGFAAAVGIAFDACIKVRIAALTGLRCPSLAYLVNDVRCERERALAMGQLLAHQYAACGALSALLAEGVTSLAATLEDFAPGTEVPLQAKLDATTRIAVHDWKVAGANKPGTRSPTQGYLRLWDTDHPCIDKGAHAKAGEPLENHEFDWATQLTVYGMALGMPYADRIGSIDELIVGKDGRLRVAQHRGVITKAFQLEVRQRLIDAWARIRENRVVPPEIAEHGYELMAVMR